MTKKAHSVTFYSHELIAYSYYLISYFDKLIQLAYSLTFYLSILPMPSYSFYVI